MGALTLLVYSCPRVNTSHVAAGTQGTPSTRSRPSSPRRTSTDAILTQTHSPSRNKSIPPPEMEVSTEGFLGI